MIKKVVAKPMAPSDTKMGKLKSSMNIEQACKPSQTSRMTRTLPILTIVAIAILVSVIALSVFLVFAHLKLANQLETIVEFQQSAWLVGTNSKMNPFNSSQLYTFGGADKDKSFLSSGSRYNSSSGEWTSIRSMPLTATQMCGAVVGDKVYLFGGFTGSVSQLFKLNSATVYETSRGTYTSLRPMPDSRETCGAAALNGYIYVAGGSVGYYGSSSSVIRYNIRTNEWSTVRSMNTRRRGSQLVELGGRLYAIGGENVYQAEVYDPSADQWLNLANTKYQRTYFAATAHEGKIYVINKSGFEVYSPETNRWETLTMPNYDFHDIVSMNGKLWTTGGSVNEKWNAVKTVFSYDTSTKQWTRHEDMDIARQYHSSFVVNH